MGSWGTAIHSNDISCDVRDMCNEVYPLVGIERRKELIFKEYENILNRDVDNEYANFWFALADWHWKHGVLSDDRKQHFEELKESGKYAVIALKNNESVIIKD